MKYASFVIYTFKCLHNSYLFVNMTVSKLYAASLTSNPRFTYVFLLLLITKSMVHQQQGLFRENEPSVVSEWTELNALSSFQRAQNCWFGRLLVLSSQNGRKCTRTCKWKFLRGSSSLRCSRERSRRVSSPGIAVTFTPTLRWLVLGLWTWRTTFLISCDRASWILKVNK
jgi:hypothetical protein